MQNTFNTLINSYIENKVGIAEGFINGPLSKNLKQNLFGLYRNKQLRVAGTGESSNVDYTNLFRGDVIYWLDRKHNNLHENNFFDIIDLFVAHLNETCYTGITDYEFHYTMYEKGSFYKKHLDQFRNDDKRKFSMIMYLNDDWVDGDGGELRIHIGDTLLNISPVGGKSVFFKSDELEHEVLETNKERLSITGWLRV